MSYRSLLTGTVAACVLLSGGLALADSFNISNDYSLTNSLGASLNEGSVTLGAFNSNTWSYNMETQEWNFQGRDIAQDQLKYSDLVNMQNSFTNTLNQTGTVTNGSFNMEGADYQFTAPAESPVCLMITGEGGETAVFVFRSVSGENNPVLNYGDLDISGSALFDLWLTTKENAQANELDYYAECILGNVNLENGAVQLLVPEPASATLSLLGLAALMMRRRRS